MWHCQKGTCLQNGSWPEDAEHPAFALSKHQGRQVTPPFTSAHVCTWPRRGENWFCGYARVLVRRRVHKCEIHEESGATVWISEYVMGDQSLGKIRQRQEWPGTTGIRALSACSWDFGKGTVWDNGKALYVDVGDDLSVHIFFSKTHQTAFTICKYLSEKKTMEDKTDFLYFFQRTCVLVFKISATYSVCGWLLILKGLKSFSLECLF